MDSQSLKGELLTRLALSWPIEWKDLQDETGNPLRYEIAALLAGSEAHLPYFRGNDVAWLTAAADATALRGAIAGLKAWIIPSFAWEDRTRPIVQPKDYQGPLADMLREVSPTGYYRWHSTSSAARGKVVEKLILWRRVRALRPVTAQAVEPNLFELREQFQLALATGDRTLAETSVAAIDEKQLDTASNTAFMRTQLRARFSSYGDIVSDPNLSRMLVLNVPRSVRTAIIDAFFETFIRRLIERTNFAEARDAFMNQVLPRIHGLFSLARPEDSEGARWFLDQLSSVKPPPPAEPPKSREQTYFDALRLSDWRCIQEVGLELLDSGPTAFGVLVRTGLIESLTHEPNVALAARLNVFEHQPLPAQDWFEFLDCLRESRTQRAEAFLALPQRPSLQLNDLTATRAVVSGIEEFLTSPSFATDDRSAVLAQSLASLVEDLVGDREYPRCDLAAAYLTLLQLWVSNRNGSLLAGDSNVVISLATGVLQCQRVEEEEVARLLRTWWESRPVRAKLPFVLESLDLLGELSAQVGTAQGLWIDGVTFIRSRAVLITQTEDKLWRTLGRTLGFDSATILEYLPAERDDSKTGLLNADPLATAGLRKVAIVSLHSKAAKAASDLIHDRSNADVLVVDELVAGSATASARSADVILLVWAATKHSVFRAFDDVRDKLVYVQGTGLSSIVLALERWVITAEHS